MRTRNAGTPKSAPAKKTPTTKKSAAKNQTPPSNPPPEPTIESSIPTKPALASRGKQVKVDGSTPTRSPNSPASQEMPEAKFSTGKKTTRTVVRRTVVRRTPASAKGASKQTPKSTEPEVPEVKELREQQQVEDAKKAESPKDVGSTKKFNEKEEAGEPIDMESSEAVETAKKSPEKEKIRDDEIEECPNDGEFTKQFSEKEGAGDPKDAESLEVVETTKKSPEEEKIGDEMIDECPKDAVSPNKEETSAANVQESVKEEEIAVEHVNRKEEIAEKTLEDTKRKHHDVTCVKEPVDDDEKIIERGQHLTVVEKSAMQVDPVVADIANSPQNQEPDSQMQEVAAEEQLKVAANREDKVDNTNEAVNMEEDDKEPKGDVDLGNDYLIEVRSEDNKSQEVLDANGEEVLTGDDRQDHGEEAEALEEERVQLTAVAEERKIRKELEIFVGGLDREAQEDDVKKAFEQIGEVVEVRLHKDASTSKNKGYAFVRFATKEQAARALLELKNPLIYGKQCGTAPCEDNDTLFLGNICNTWTKEAIKQKLKDYGIEGVQNITLVLDPRREGFSRGFAFLEFSCHAEAMLAYKRLQKPDVVFGHPERTAKVAFAEPLREPDPEVMAQVKSVFVDGLPPNWDEERVRGHLKSYGEIVCITLARNMSTAKRKDFGFVDFSTHEAAVACVDDINNKELGDGNTKTKVKARLSNPLPKTQAVKGGMCGGFRIGRSGAGGSSNFGRGFGRGGYAFNRPSFQRGRGFYPRGRGQIGRMGFAAEHDLGVQHPPFHGRQMFGRGGWRDSFGAPYHSSGGGAAQASPNFDRIRHSATNRGRGHVLDRRQPFTPEGGFNRHFGGRHFDETSFYDDNAHGIKRPHFMTDPDYMEPSRVRPRFDYSDPSIPFQGSQHRDSLGASSSRHSHDYYNSNYGQGAYPPPYGEGRPYGGGYYY